MSFVDSSATRDLLNPSSRRDDRITRLEAQVAFLADRLGVVPDELDRHGEKPMPEGSVSWPRARSSRRSRLIVRPPARRSGVRSVRSTESANAS